MFFSDLNMQVYDKERKQWFDVKLIDVEKNSISYLYFNSYTFLKLTETEIRFKKKNKKAFSNCFYYGDVVEIKEGFTKGKVGVIVKDDSENKENKIKINFTDGVWVGWYLREELKLIKRNLKKDRKLA